MFKNIMIFFIRRRVNIFSRKISEAEFRRDIVEAEFDSEIGSINSYIRSLMVAKKSASQRLNSLIGGSESAEHWQLRAQLIDIRDKVGRQNVNK